MGKGEFIENKEELAEDYCFVCKDGGELRVCDYKNCLKSYHPECVNQDSSFLKTDEKWICGLHTCFICHRSSRYSCYGCPDSSVCSGCMQHAEFVLVKAKTKGFCTNCLRMAILIEENIDVDSDGEKIDFKDTETSEFLFKEYWDIIKAKEGIRLVDLRRANARLKGSGKYEDEFGLIKTVVSSDGDDDSEDSFDDKGSFLDVTKEKCCRKIIPLSKCSPKKRVFIGWGSEELIKFLASIGRDAKDPLTQLKASEIVRDYIEANNLYRHEGNKKRKKFVICDEKLQSLFRKKKVKQQKIYNLLQSHFAANEVSDGEPSLSSEDGGNAEYWSNKKQKTNYTCRIKKSLFSSSEKFSAPKKLCASIVKKNIKAVYLKRSLIINLLEDPDSFDKKVSGCFVRVKQDLTKNFKAQKNYWLGQVTGVKKDPHGYKIKDMFTDIILCVVSDVTKDVQIPMLSDEEFEEEECEDLRQLVKQGLFRRPTVVELKEKIQEIHADITKHWLDKEIMKLQKLIERANEKGWRKELHEYIDQRELLRTPTERKRLLEEIPEVITETCDNEDNIDSGQNELQSGEHNATGNIDVIAIEDDDPIPPVAPRARAEITGQFDIKEKIWHYCDPSNKFRGPFDMFCLEAWHRAGYFTDYFRVWRTGQSPKDAITLRSARLMCNM